MDDAAEALNRANLVRGIPVIRVQNADDDHWNDEEDDAGCLEDVSEVRHVWPNAAQSGVGDRTSLGVLLVDDSELDPDGHRTAAGDDPDDDDRRLEG